MTGQLRSAKGPNVTVVESTHAVTRIADLLTEANFSVDLIRDPDAATGAGNTELLVVAEGVMPAGGLTELRSTIGVAADIPAMLILEPGSQVSIPDDIACLTWPVSSTALSAACHGLLLESGRVNAIRARSPGGASASVLYGEIVAMAASALTQAAEGRMPDLGAVRLLAERIHSQLLRDNGLVNQSLEPHAVFDLASHSANVAIIAGKIALGLAVGVEDSVRVIMAGIVHDMGMARLPISLLHSSGRLSEEEQQQLRTHPLLGAELLDGIESRYSWLPNIILHEHERMQGQGYPSGIGSSAIDSLAKIIGLSDVFEALSHPRSYRSPYTALEALEQVSDMRGEYFESGMVAALVNEISAFPMDSYVQLSTGEIGQVVGTNPDNILRPEVVIRWDDSWNPVETPQRIDLVDTPDVTIARALREAELPIT
jgi:hypothetical protein